MPVYQNLSDNELIAFLREGDAAAYTEIYDRYFQLMFLFAYKKLRDEELARDFVQELFIKLWEQRQRLSEIATLGSYLYVSMRNKVLDHFSHIHVNDKYIDFLIDFTNNSKSIEADFKIREKQLADYIELQIQSLPSKMRRIFELSRKEYLSHKEIAARLETTEYNVAKQVTNALRIIKSKLGSAISILFLL